ncbi:hypothetical protein [Dactylosporangium sp. NPDC000521]|uniref:hypothetical protein n=1 Tax=Dactylosporangium sp. NPDC000521 TaxID=3363975 RepID=UPI0036BB9BA4
MTTVREIMTPDVTCVQETETLRDAARGRLVPRRPGRRSLRTVASPDGGTRRRTVRAGSQARRG